MNHRLREAREAVANLDTTDWRIQTALYDVDEAIRNVRQVIR